MDSLRRPSESNIQVTNIGARLLLEVRRLEGVDRPVLLGTQIPPVLSQARHRFAMQIFVLLPCSPHFGLEQLLLLHSAERFDQDSLDLRIWRQSARILDYLTISPSQNLTFPELIPARTGAVISSRTGAGSLSIKLSMWFRYSSSASKYLVSKSL